MGVEGRRVGAAQCYGEQDVFLSTTCRGGGGACRGYQPRLPPASKLLRAYPLRCGVKQITIV